VSKQKKKEPIAKVKYKMLISSKKFKRTGPLRSYQMQSMLNHISL
jgi:hypothetical protein